MEIDILEKVFLLAILKKEEDENPNDILLKLESTGTFTMKEGKSVLKSLKKEGYIENGQLSIKGIAEAQKAEEEFKL